MITLLNVVAVVAAIVGAIVILLFFLGGGTDAVVPDRRIHINFLFRRNGAAGRCVLPDVTTRTLDTIRLEIERATERRAELLQVLAEGHDAVVAAEHAEVEETIARLWDEYREARARPLRRP